MAAAVREPRRSQRSRRERLLSCFFFKMSLRAVILCLLAAISLADGVALNAPPGTSAPPADSTIVAPPETRDPCASCYARNYTCLTCNDGRHACATEEQASKNATCCGCTCVSVNVCFNFCLSRLLRLTFLLQSEWSGINLHALPSGRFLYELGEGQIWILLLHAILFE